MGTQYDFSRSHLGDTGVGRPNLGPLMRVEAYRLMQLTLRSTLSRELGLERTDAVLRDAGHLAGLKAYEHAIGPVSDLAEFFHRLHKFLKDLGVGLLRVERADPEAGTFVLTISEDADCSGLPRLAHFRCRYEEGVLAGVMEGFMGQAGRVREVDCWSTGARTCRYVIEPDREQ